MSRKREETPSALAGSKEIATKLRDLEAEQKAAGRSFDQRRRSLESELYAARARETPAVAPPAAVTPEEAAAIRERNRDRAAARAKVGALKLTLQKRRMDRDRIRHDRAIVHDGRKVLEERFVNGERKRVAIQMPGDPEAAEAFDSDLAEHEDAINKLERELVLAEAKLASYGVSG